MAQGRRTKNVVEEYKLLSESSENQQTSSYHFISQRMMGWGKDVQKLISDPIALTNQGYILDLRSNLPNGECR